MNVPCPHEGLQIPRMTAIVSKLEIISFASFGVNSDLTQVSRIEQRLDPLKRLFRLSSRGAFELIEMVMGLFLAFVQVSNSEILCTFVESSVEDILK